MITKDIKDIKYRIKYMLNGYQETGKIDIRFLEHNLDELYEIVESYCDLLNFFLENQKKLNGWYKCIDRDYEEYEYTIETDYGDYELDFWQKEYLTEMCDYDFWKAEQ